VVGLLTIRWYNQVLARVGLHQKESQIFYLQSYTIDSKPYLPTVHEHTIPTSWRLSSSSIQSDTVARSIAKSNSPKPSPLFSSLLPLTHFRHQPRIQPCLHHHPRRRDLETSLLASQTRLSPRSISMVTICLPLQLHQAPETAGNMHWPQNSSIPRVRTNMELLVCPSTNLQPSNRHQLAAALNTITHGRETLLGHIWNDI